MSLPTPIGVMQGRLLPKYQGRYQAHPRGYWRDEFPVAASLGLSLIEFILDFDGAEDNPLLTPDGAAAILAATAQTGVAVRTVCADYFMEAPLHRPTTANDSLAVMLRLIQRAGEIGVTDVVLPCVDQSRLADDGDFERLAVALEACLPAAEAAGLNLSLETDLDPVRFAHLLEQLPSPRITVNYDIGNSAALGFKPREEFAAYGRRISDLHIKDRVLGGGSVVLGTGDADFAAVIDCLARVGFRGPFIMQAFRDDEGVAVFRCQLDWLAALWPDGQAS